MFSRKKEKVNPFYNQREKKDNPTIEFRSVINKQMSIAIYETKRGSTTLVIKKELSDYEIECVASEAPEKNYIGQIMSLGYNNYNFISFRVFDLKILK